MFGAAAIARSAVLRRIVQNVDVLVGNEEDLQKGLGVAGAGEAVKTYPQIKVVATTLREVHSANRHTWSATAWIEWPNLSTRQMRVGCLRSRGRRRWIRGRILLWTAGRANLPRTLSSSAGHTARW